MANRWYILPIELYGGSMRAPKYMINRLNPTGINAKWSMMDYGLMNVCIMLADVTTEQHDALVANSDVRGIVQHANVDNTVPAGAVTAVRNGLESLDIPGQWVDTSDTWRVVLRTTAALFQFAQRLHGRFGVKIIPDGYSLNTTWSELPQQAKDFLLDVAAELNIDTSGATGATTLRTIYKAFADAWGATPIFIGGIEL